MLKLVKVAVFATLVLTTVVVQAQGKTAVLNIQQAILMTDESQKRLTDLRARASYKENKKQLDELVAEHDEIIKRLQKDAAVMGDDERQQQQRTIQEKRADIEHVRNKLQVSEQELGQALMQSLAPKLQQVVTELLKTEGIGLLLSSEAVLHADNSYDITAKVTDRLNRAR